MYQLSLRIILFTVLFVFLQNCSTGIMDRTLQGTVFLEKNGEPVEGATVSLLERNNGNNPSVIGQTKTDNQGSFSIQYHRGTGDEWFVVVAADSLGGGSVPIKRRQNSVQISI